MIAAPSKIEEMSALIQPKEFAAAGFEPPKRVVLREGQDYTGAESLYIYLIFPNKTPTAKLAPAKVTPMKRWAKERIREADGYDRSVYARALRAKTAATWLS